MNYFELILPQFDNNGVELTARHGLMHSYILTNAGGFTLVGGKHLGYWVDIKTQTTYRDTVAILKIATTPEIFAGIVREAFRLFPDQAALFYANTGHAVIDNRPETLAA